MIERRHQEAEDHGAGRPSGDGGGGLRILEGFVLTQPFFGDTKGGELGSGDESIGDGGFDARKEALNLEL